MLEWFLGPQTIHPAGQHGVTAILADASSNMDPPLMMASLAQAKQHEPTARVRLRRRGRRGAISAPTDRSRMSAATGHSRSSSSS
jgi:hypothetical protein